MAAGLDLLHTFEESRRAGGGQGLFSTTGGLLGTSIGGTPSTQEQVRKELTAPEATSSFSDRDLKAQLQAEKAAGQTTHAFGLFGTGQRDIDELLKKLDEPSDILKDRMDFFNEQIRRGGSAAKFASVASLDGPDLCRGGRQGGLHRARLSRRQRQPRYPR